MRTAGRGALAVVSKMTGLARSTINCGEDDLVTSDTAEFAVQSIRAGSTAWDERATRRRAS
jgi:hypothetical protein